MALRRTTTALLLAGVLGCTGARASSATVADGQREYDAGNYAAARTIWAAVTAADLGGEDQAQAQLGLGLIYDLGQGVPADPVMAYECYLTAAEAGLPAAAFNVAVMNDSGTGTPRDIAAAATWYGRAAARGHHRAEYNLAQLYATGQGVPQNPEAAAAWFRAAAGGNLGAAAAQPRPPWLPKGEPARSGQSKANPPRVGPELQQVRLAAPANGETRPASTLHSVEFVWVAPPQPVPVRYFLEVVTLGGDGVKEIASRYLEPTATVVDLPDGPALYEWHVYAVGQQPDGAAYSMSNWSVFYAQ